MKITIEPDNKESGYPTVSIHVDGEDLTIEEVVEECVRPALFAWFGYDALGKYLD